MVTQPGSRSTRTERRARIVEWAAYLLLSSMVGLLWLPLMFIFFSTTRTQLPHTIATVLLASFLYAVLFRALSLERGKEPGLWLAMAFPLIGTLSRSGMMSILDPGADFEKVVAEFVFTTFLAYTCAGIFLVPLAMLNQLAIQWLHGTLREWAMKASWRSVHHASYALGCAVLLLATEAPRTFTAADTFRASMMVGEASEAWTGPVETIAAEYDASLPSGAELVAEAPASGATKKFWFRSEQPIPWPPSPKATQVVQPEEDVLITQRATDEAGADLSQQPVHVRQAKWTVGVTVVRAHLVRSGGVDYLELKAGPR